MASVGFILIGLVFGIVLAAIVFAFVLIRLAEKKGGKLFGDHLDMTALVAGRKAPGTSPTAPRPEEGRIRLLQEEVKVLQRMLDQARVERETSAAEKTRLETTAAELKVALGERDERIRSLEKSLGEHYDRAEALREQLSQREDNLSETTMRLRDIQTELGVVQAGSGVVAGQIEKLTRERDQLIALVRKMRRENEARSRAPATPA